MTICFRLILSFVLHLSIIMLIYAAGRAEQNIKLNIDTRCCLQNVAMATSTTAAKWTTAQQTPTTAVTSVERNLNLLQQTQRFGQNMP